MTAAEYDVALRYFGPRLWGVVPPVFRRPDLPGMTEPRPRRYLAYHHLPLAWPERPYYLTGCNDI